MNLHLPSNALKFTNEHQSPHFAATVRELAQKADIPTPRIAYLDIEKLQNHPLQLLFRSTAAVFHLEDGPVVVIGDIGGRLGAFSKPSDKISPELKAVIAHEFGHIVHKDLHKGGLATIGKNFPIIGALAGAGGYLLYSYQQQKNHSEPLDTQTPDRAINAFDILVDTSKLIATTAVGLSAGKASDIGTKWAMEFRADSYSAKLLQDGKPLATYLSRMNELGQSLRSQGLEALRQQGTSELKISKLIAKEEWMMRQMHPPFSWRINRLESMQFPSR